MTKNSLNRRNETVDIGAIFRPEAKAAGRWWKDYPPLTERELLLQVIEFANTGSARAFALLRHGVRISDPELERLSRREESRYRSQRKREQAYLKDVLPRIVALWAGKRGTGIDEAMRDLWLKHAGRLTFVPTMGPGDFRPPWRNDLPRLRYRFTGTAAPPLPPSAYMLVRLLVQPHWQRPPVQQPWEPRGRSDLSCCKQCSKLFLAWRPDDRAHGGQRDDRDGEVRGRTARDYCTTKCRAKAERKQAAVRMERKRARDRVAKQQKTQQSTRRRK
jgi:hypothetical protein